MTVIVVQNESSGQLIKVCENHESFRQWLDATKVERRDVMVKIVKVRKEQ